MSEKIMNTDELCGVRVVGGKKSIKRIGKVRACVFHPTSKRCVGFLVKRPDLLWMFYRKDKFIAIDGYEFEDGRIVVSQDAGAEGSAACKRLGIAWDECVLWVGLPVLTSKGENLGLVGSVSFDVKTGAVISLETDTGATSNALLGKKTIPASYVKGFRRGMGAALTQNGQATEEEELGAILVSEEALEISAEGGLAEQAGKATAVVANKAQETANKVKPKVSQAAKTTGKAVNKGAYATGKQLGRAKGMFSDFKKEYNKARHD